MYICISRHLNYGKGKSNCRCNTYVLFSFSVLTVTRVWEWQVQHGHMSGQYSQQYCTMDLIGIAFSRDSGNRTVVTLTLVDLHIGVLLVRAIVILSVSNLFFLLFVSFLRLNISLLSALSYVFFFFFSFRCAFDTSYDGSRFGWKW